MLCKRKLKLTELNETKSKDKLAKQMREEKKQRKEIGHSVPESLSSEKDQLLRKIATKGGMILCVGWMCSCNSVHGNQNVSEEEAIGEESE